MRHGDMPLKKMEKQVWSTNFNYSACSLQFVSWNVQEERSSLLIRFCTTLCWGGLLWISALMIQLKRAFAHFTLSTSFSSLRLVFLCILHLQDRISQSSAPPPRKLWILTGTITNEYISSVIYTLKVGERIYLRWNSQHCPRPTWMRYEVAVVKTEKGVRSKRHKDWPH